ncbi:hypothetical protein L599_007200000030 [Luteimonas sp. J16]|jgi:hypothetical protein|uniref:hypothetical protein n=1 Tax=unclassified Luteimonas TaxID=2629088 RepID=UPI0004B235F7|nr:MULTISPECIES: hypothetical protein [unclassified Luteimonas]TWG86592.1 hypothetical protein L599_007200000030 [Luteimonas sp. J16]
MTVRTLRLLVALLAGGCASTVLAQDAIRPEQATRHVGQTGMVCGKVEKTRYAENSEGQPTFLHMGGMFPRHTFSARIPQELRGKFRPTPEELEGRDVCVIGTIQRDASRAEIAIGSPSDVKLATIK